MMAETIEKIVLHYESRRENLLAAIKEINAKLGFFQPKAVKILARHFGMKPAEVFSAASFYDQIKTQKPARIIIKVCDSANCQVKMADKVIKALEALLHQKAGDNFNANVRIERVSCLGHCTEGPNIIINGTLYNKMNAGKAVEIIEEYFQ